MNDWAPIAISVAALACSLTFGLLSIQDRRLTIRLRRERELLDWIMQVKSAYAGLQSSDASAVQEALQDLGLLIDLGRLFFPNDKRGLRSHVLDPLVESFRSCAAGEHNFGG